MATDLRCPNCSDNIGKDKENSVDAHCGTCGESFYNPYGYTYDQKHYEMCRKKYPGRKIPLPDKDDED